MRTETDQLSQWLLDGIELDTAEFHLGQYCGCWRASSAGRALGSFHLVLRGACYLHIGGVEPVALQARDGVFLLRDIAHFLSPGPDPAAPAWRLPMQPLRGGDGADGATGLACGFFQFRGALSAMIVDSLPDYLIVRSDDPALHATGALFDLILAEAEAGVDPARPSALVARLVELLFFYLMRHVTARQPGPAGLLALLRRPEFSTLLEHMLRAPAADWSLESMARMTHMSRASFCKHFVAACGHPPAQFLMLLRMRIAAQRLHAGESVERAAEHVGYNSHAAFSRAFARALGEQPGAYRRGKRQGAPARQMTAMAAPARPAN